MAAIILNGTSSSGKSSIAKAIQKLSPEPFLHISLDAIVDMFRWDEIKGKELRMECHSVGISNFHKILPILLSSRFSGIIDHVFEQDSWYHDCLDSVSEYRVLLVAVKCPLQVLQEREMNRGDRRIGLAEYQFSKVHQNRKYDLEVDTSIQSPEECALRILAAYQTQSEQSGGTLPSPVPHL